MPLCVCVCVCAISQVQRRDEYQTGADIDNGQWAVLDLLNKREMEWKTIKTKEEAGQRA